MVEKLTQRVINYIYNYKPIINYGALFSDGTERFRSPAEPKSGDSVTLRFRTARDNVDYVYLIYNGSRFMMKKTSKADRLFDYYEYTLPPLTERGYYHFEVGSGSVTIFYNKLGIVKEAETQYDFELIPDFYVPSWAKSAVFYQIFVDRFNNGDKSNDVLTNEYTYIGTKSKQVKNWDKVPDAIDVGNFYGGDLQGVIDKLDYLQDLGIDAIYFNPLFVSPSNHKYDIQDYDYIDPHYGKIVVDKGKLLSDDQDNNMEATRYIERVTNLANLEASNELFIELVKKAHARGIKVILDGVFNHCGSFNKWMDRERIYEGREGYAKGAYVDAKSPYNSFFKFREKDKWPYNGNYDGWWGHDTLPKLNYEESEKLHDYIMKIGAKWVSPPYNCDGWRLDVAADLGSSEEYNHRFWRDFRNAVRNANPEAIILAEHYGNPKPWLQGDQWDTIMNYGAFMEPITWFLTGVEKHSDEFRGDFLGNPDIFWDSMRYYMSCFNQNSIEVAMNELSNHDHSRFLTRTNRRVGRIHTMGAEAADQNINKDIFRQAVLFQMTWPGAPTIYYGDEAGVCGWTDPDSRRTYPWGHEDKELIRFHKDMIKLHKSSEALMKGSLIKLHGSNKCIAFGRFTENEAAAIVLNCDYEDKKIQLHVRHLGVPNNMMMKRVILTHEGGYYLDDQANIVQNNYLTAVIPKMSAAVYIYKNNWE
ncbi:MAG: glycoside hydrolase family 13 protein [Eubacterium sp.]|nr:glycoside hydrolase family 13 protein [Eubacterium sp.]